MTETKKSKKIAHIVLTAVCAFVLVLGIALDVVVFNVIDNVLNFRFGKAAVSTVSEKEKAERREKAIGVAELIAEEGFVLMENNGTLPYTSEDKKVDLLGSAAAVPVYGGQGSSETSDNATPIDFAAAFTNAGYTVNTDIIDFYKNGGYVTEGVHGVGQTDFKVKDPDPDMYWDLTSDADLAVVVFGRSGGEDNDLPLEMESDNPADADKHTLELSAYEHKMLSKAAEKYENVIAVFNSAHPLEPASFSDLMTGDAGTTGNVDALIWVGMPGYHGLPKLVDIIEGAVNPSGKLPDTYAYDSLSSAAMSGYMSKGMNDGNYYSNLLVEGAGGKIYAGGELKEYDGAATYMEYAEGIYVGYRYYETAAELGYIDYAAEVAYPFGYGMSYSDFGWSIDKSASVIPDEIDGDSTFEIAVDVTNDSETPGMDIVQMYLTLDADELRAGKLDRSAVSLVAYAKTPVIAPGATERVMLEFSAEDIASYDDKAIYSSSGSYVIERGEYTFRLRADSHTDKENVDPIVIDLTAPIVYSDTSTDASADTSVSKRPSDLVTAVNRMGTYDESILSGTKYDMGVNYLGLASSETEWLNGTGRKGALTANDSLVGFIANGENKSITNKGYVVHDDFIGTTASGGSLSVMNFGSVDFDDESWNDLVEQMPIEEASELILYGGYMTNAAPSVGKEATTDSDGPCGIAFIFRQGEFPGVSYPCYTVVAATWNEEVAFAYGDAVSLESESFSLTGWYAPGANLHRTPFGGRNFEYPSEDPLLAGITAANTAAAAALNGTPTYMKHYALNEQETNRGNNLITWTTEQAARELYLRAFELAVKADSKYGLGASPAGVMTSFNYVGDRWAGASYQLCTEYLRDEWGFRGTVVTDYFGNSSYMDAACAIRAGNDMMLGTIAMSLGDKSSGDTLYYVQKAAKNILYTYSRSWNVRNGLGAAGGMQPWQAVALAVNIVWWLGTAVLAFFAVRGWIKVIRDKKQMRTESE